MTDWMGPTGTGRNGSSAENSNAIPRFAFFPVCALAPELRKMVSTYYRQDLPPDIHQVDAMAA